MNTYQYANTNPVQHVDPQGLKTCIGCARVLQGNSRLIGKSGGFNTYPPNLKLYGVTAISAAIIPSQWICKKQSRNKKTYPEATTDTKRFRIRLECDSNTSSF